MIYVVDAFTSEPFKGNPAGVCLLEEPLTDAQMQSLAAEVNHAETAFPRRREDGDWDLRWFTPTCEVDLCGHATLATAHILLKDGEIRFHTRSGVLSARRDGAEIELDFPAERASILPLTDEIKAIVGGEPVWFGKNRMDYIVELADEAAVLSFKPDLAKIRELGERGLIVTAPASTIESDYVSRFFAPQFGVDEDPVTGSAHCCLGPYWSAKLGHDALIGYQASSRGGFVGTTVAGERVKLRGTAITTFSLTIVTPI